MKLEIRYLVLKIFLRDRSGLETLNRVVGPFADMAELGNWQGEAAELSRDPLLQQEGVIGVEFTQLERVPAVASDPDIPPSVLVGDMLKQYFRHIKLIRSGLDSGNYQADFIRPAELN